MACSAGSPGSSPGTRLLTTRPPTCSTVRLGPDRILKPLGQIPTVGTTHASRVLELFGEHAAAHPDHLADRTLRVLQELVCEAPRGSEMLAGWDQPGDQASVRRLLRREH